MSGYYIYCLASKSDISARLPRKGVSFSGNVSAEKYKDISAIISRVEDKKINKNYLKMKLENDNAWAKENIFLHHKVVSSAQKYGAVIPMKFGTIISSRAHLSRLLRDGYRAYKRLLSQLEGREEWGFKIYIEYDNLPEIIKRKMESRHKNNSPGLQWFSDKKEEMTTREKLERAIGGRLEKALETLKKNSENLVLSAPLPQELDSHKGEMIINSSVLIKKEKFPDFSTKIRKLKKDLEDYGLETELTGPWPPYSFANIDKNK